MKTHAIILSSVMLASAAALAACQTGGKANQTSDVSTDESQVVQSGESTPDTDASGGQYATANDAQIDNADTVTASVSTSDCMIPLAGGPPAKPARGADFGTAVVKDTGKTVQRSILQIIGGHVGGQIGAAASGAVATTTIRSEGDIKGIWNITDGTQSCACTLHVDGLVMMQGKGKDSGSIKPQGCSNQVVSQIAGWALGHSFTGYDAKFELKAADKRTVLATLKRDGIHYFSGTLSDGTPVTIWRDGQNYNQMKYGKK